MRERTEALLKIVCATLGLLLLVQVGRVALRSSPLAHVKIPALPTLPPEPAAQPGGIGTNPPPPQSSPKSGTNLPSPVGTRQGTNPSVAVTNATTRGVSGSLGTNSAGLPDITRAATNAGPQPPSGKRGSAPGAPSTSDRSDRASDRPAEVAGPAGMASPPPGRPVMGMSPGGGPMPGRRGPELPAGVQARVDKITDSEVLAPVIRPLPMALLGIAGKDAFLRAPNGQTGLVKEGEELGAVKLLRIGTNRVLVEQDGQKKELSIFSGYGGDPLVPASTEKAP
jgi:hypothetical protein